MKTLDVGCGLKKRADAIGIDNNPRSHADVIHDLNAIPYPFHENEFDEIVCDNVLEHLDNVLHVMEELHRVAKPNARVTVIVPFFGHRNAYNDITHRHFFCYHSFDYLVDGTSHSEYHYSSVRYLIRSITFDKNAGTRHWFDRWICRFANRHPDLYENRLSHVVPVKTITYELVVVK
jgi:SAM-dependent methyltransferase